MQADITGMEGVKRKTLEHSSTREQILDWFFITSINKCKRKQMQSKNTIIMKHSF